MTDKTCRDEDGDDDDDEGDDDDDGDGDGDGDGGGGDCGDDIRTICLLLIIRVVSNHAQLGITVMMTIMVSP